eukprot:364692-Chlamydomonas_euryale.AAC.11
MAQGQGLARLNEEAPLAGCKQRAGLPVGFCHACKGMPISALSCNRQHALLSNSQACQSCLLDMRQNAGLCYSDLLTLIVAEAESNTLAAQIGVDREFIVDL